MSSPQPLDVRQQLTDARLVVVGGTGFLGKVWLAMLLHRYPDVGRIYLVVRSRPNKDSTKRFWSEVASSHPFDAIRDELGERFESLLREKVVPIDADVSRPLCGFSKEMLDELSGTIDAVVNVAGVVDFSPPLDEALNANAFGVQNLVDLAKALGDTPVLHTSTAYVAGYRAGHIGEEDPRETPFPNYGKLERVHWDPAREISECLDLVAQARHRADDAFRENAFLETARKNLRERGEPARGSALQDELGRVRRKFIEQKLIEAGNERATYWGWTNIYTYTKSLGEQILAGSGLPFTIVRPTVIESAMSYPFPGWNEGINTMAPLTFLFMRGHIQVPMGERTTLDIIPVDYVAAGMILSLAALLQETHKPVYQLGTSDQNGLLMKRLIDLCGIYKRKHYLRKGKGNPFVNFLQAHVEPIGLPVDRFYMHGAPAIARVSRLLASGLRQAAVGPTAGLLKPAAGALESYASLAQRNGDIWEMFIPFMAGTEYFFECTNVRELYARTTEKDRAAIPWHPETLDWRMYFHEVHLPGLEKWCLPEIDEKISRPTRPLRSHDDLVALLEESASQHDLAVALQRYEPDGLTRITFRDWKNRAEATAGRLHAMGIGPGDRVLLSGQNHPDWPIAYFGVLRAGAVGVPVDPALEESALLRLLRASKAKLAIFDEKLANGAGARAVAALEAETKVATVLFSTLTDENDAPAPPPLPAITKDTLASIIYTSGTTGTPKGVMLTHGNFVSLLSSLGPVFPLKTTDRALSVLPLHHTFEFTCGMLLPLSRGTRIIYLDELNGERLTAAMKEARVTAMVGVPALWQLLERRIISRAKQQGPTTEALFDAALSFNRLVGRKLGADVGRVLFGPVHEALGGNIRLLISGGAALPKETAEVFAGLGLHLAEGYGLTEAAPVLSAQKPGPAVRPGSVGKALPGVELKIDAPDADGVGEVLARGANVMAGYADDPDATAQVLDSEGWLHTGDLGRIDKHGQLTIVGRSKDVIVGANGENIYPDDIERALGSISGIAELGIVGIEDPRGGERAACIAVPTAGHDGETLHERSVRREKALRNLREAVSKLPRAQQPPVVLLYDAELPRTATRKVKRKETREIVERLIAASDAPKGAGKSSPTSSAELVRKAVATIARRPVSEVQPNTRLRTDLGFDSLMLMELSVALENAAGKGVPDLAQLDTVAEIAQAFGSEAVAEAPRPTAPKHEDEETDVRDTELPEALKDLAKAGLAVFQREFYGSVMKPKVSGRAFIPQNRNTIVVANHTSHLDMGFVKYALGSYGRDLVSLAAKDYFFAPGTWTGLWVRNFTNLAPLDRHAGLKHTLREVGDLLDAGKTVLIFPEGTRSPDGNIKEFKGAVGHLALRHGVDILPVYLGGTYESMPKKSRFPRSRELMARIGPPLCVEDLRRLVAPYKTVDQARKAALLAQRAVEALRDGSALELTTVDSIEAFEEGERKHPLVVLFTELNDRFVPGIVQNPLSFYFTLGSEPEAKWTVRVTPEKCEVLQGKAFEGRADCVLKTSAAMFTRIVREGYTPSADEFVSGIVSSNDPFLLETFQKAFQLA